MEVHRVQVFNFGGLPDLMAEGLSARMLMEHRDAHGESLFTSRAWRRLFDIRGPLVHELILEFFSTFRFGQAILDLVTLGALQFQLGGARRRISWRQFILSLGLHTNEEIQTAGFTLSYTAIWDPILRLCHRLIACSIAERSQTPEKVTVIDLFYLRGMDVDSINVPYLLARYLRLFAAGRKSGAYIFRGQFVARLAEHFGLLTVEILGELMVISPELPIIDMAELEVLIRASRLKKVMANKGKKSSMETFMPNDKANYYSGITSITVNGKNSYELKGKFLDDLHNNAFSGTNGSLISDDESSDDYWKRWKSHEIYYHNYDEREYENETHKERHELCGIKSHEVPVCQIKRYKMIKYSFNDEEEYVAIKEDEYDDFTITSKSCRAT
ncbi:hypothetical protein Tco_0455838 [Tanacetum coccineum]